MTLFVGAEEVLFVPGDLHGPQRPIAEGIEVVNRLSALGRLVVGVHAPVSEHGTVEQLLKLHGLRAFTLYGVAPENLLVERWRGQWQLVRRLRSEEPIELVVTGYGSVYKQCLANHQPVLLYGRRGSLGLGPVPPEPWEDVRRRNLEAQEARVSVETDGLERAAG